MFSRKKKQNSRRATPDLSRRISLLKNQEQNYSYKNAPRRAVKSRNSGREPNIRDRSNIFGHREIRENPYPQDKYSTNDENSFDFLNFSKRKILSDQESYSDYANENTGYGSSYSSVHYDDEYDNSFLGFRNSGLFGFMFVLGAIGLSFLLGYRIGLNEKESFELIKEQNTLAQNKKSVDETIYHVPYIEDNLSFYNDLQTGQEENIDSLLKKKSPDQSLSIAVPELPVSNVDGNLKIEESAYSVEDVLKKIKKVDNSLGMFTIQVGAYNTEKDAANYAHQLKGLGLVAEAKKIPHLGKAQFKVSIGEFDNITEANKQLGILKSKYNLDGFVKKR